MPLAAGDKLGPYQITSPLGKGGMGEVYCARDSRLNRDVAIKVSAEQFAERFEREAHAVAALNHPNICSLYDVGPNYLVMELIEGPTLADRIKEGPIALEEALGIARQIAEALEAAHEKNITHRDLKPANIKIKPDGTVKVLDFGLAKMGGTPTAPTEDSPTIAMGATQAGVILGTAAYMSPEQARGKVVDKRADIWAFGVVLYEMLTGQTVFVGETVSDTLAAVLTRDPDLERVPARVHKLLRSCLAKDPKKRLRDIGDAWQLLDETSEPHVAHQRTRIVPWIVPAALALIAASLAFTHFREVPAAAPVVRFSIPPPEKGSFAEWLSLSPDGRHLAFPGLGSDGGLHVWIRSFDSLEPRVLVDAESSSTTVTLFWSPDSRFVVYQSGGKVRKIDIAGGPPQTLCDAPAVMLGGSWNANGVILFGSNSGPIMRVSSAGGTASPVTRMEQSRDEGLHTDPFFLPDGVHFLYFRHSGKPEDQGVFVGSLNTSPEEQSLKRIVAADYSPAYAPPHDAEPGYLLFLRENSLLAQRFDATRMEAEGEAVPIAGQIRTSITRALLSVSGNGVLAYRTGTEVGRAQLRWYDREGHVLGTVAEAGDYQDATISPDGSRVAYDRSTQGANRQIWILDIARGIHSRFTFVPEGVRSPVWSPDSARMAFASQSRTGIYIQGVTSGGDPQRVFDSRALTVTGWSPDGRFLLYTYAGRAYDLMALPASPGGGERKPLAIADSDANEMHAQVSPDSQWVAYDSNESGKSEVYVRPFPPGGERAGKWQISGSGGQQPRWRGDGKELYYIAADRTLMAVDVKTQPRFEAAAAHPLFATPSIAGNSLPFEYDVMKDGKRFIVVAPSVGAVSTPATVVQNWEAVLRK